MVQTIQPLAVTELPVVAKSELNCKTDEDLISLYVCGNNSAFDVILQRYQSKVFAYLYKVVGSQEMAEDLFQDVFIKVVMRLRGGQYCEHGKFSSWLMRLVHNHVIDHFRTSPRQIVVSNDDSEHNHLNDPCTAVNENREQEFVEYQNKQELKWLIDMLPEAQREVVMLRYFEDMSFKDIAKKTGSGINTALGRMHYAIRNLRRMALKYGLCMAS